MWRSDGSSRSTAVWPTSLSLTGSQRSDSDAGGDHGPVGGTGNILRRHVKPGPSLNVEQNVTARLGGDVDQYLNSTPGRPDGENYPAAYRRLFTLAMRAAWVKGPYQFGWVAVVVDATTGKVLEQGGGLY